MIKNNSAIKIINLLRRPDRKEFMEQQLIKNNNTNYEFIEAVDGKNLEPTVEIKNLFSGNNFNYRKGVIGCALSHYNLWKDLIDDENNEYYLIMEDDATLCEGFNEKIEQVSEKIKIKDVIFFGYHMYKNQRESVKNIYENNNESITLHSLNTALYIGGTHFYSISKKGAKKIIDYIRINGIICGIDYLLICSNLECYESQPHLATAEWNEGGKTIDTDIQSNYECMNFNCLINDNSDLTATIEILGGLGNQLFQIFTLLSYCISTNKLFYFENKPINYGTRKKYYLDTPLLNKLKVFIKEPIHTFIYNEPFFNYAPIPLFNKENSDKNIKLRGFFQSYKYFQEHKEFICKMIQLKESQEEVREKVSHYFKTISFENIVSLHFRVGDYTIQQDGHPLLKNEYYEKALEQLMVDLNKKDNLFILYFYEENDKEYVNDRINYLKQNEKFKNLTFIKTPDNLDDWEQMILMTLCHHYIIANSTFSWWGAYLSEHSEEATYSVYYPSKWFGPSLEYNKIDDLFLDGWKKVIIGDYFPKNMKRHDLVKSIVSKIDNGVIVEIGTHTGNFADHILSNTTSKLYCIDPYVSYDEYDDAINNYTGDTLYNNTKQSLISKYGDRVIFIRKFSELAVNDIPDEIDFLYIDGNHRYSYVYKDLELFYTKIKTGGFIVGDDAVDIDDSKRNENGDVLITWFPDCYGNYGVIKAFREFSSKKFISGEIIGDQYMLIKR